MNTSLPTQAAAGEINSLILPTIKDRLLLPMTAVAEVIHGVSSLEPGPDSDYFYVWIHWREQRIPLVSWEALAGAGKQPLQGVYKIAIINAVDAATDLGFFAMRLTDFPSSARVNQDTNLQIRQQKLAHKGEQLHVLLEDDAMIIPDLKHLETLCQQYAVTTQ